MHTPAQVEGRAPTERSSHTTMHLTILYYTRWRAGMNNYIQKRFRLCNFLAIVPMIPSSRSSSSSSGTMMDTVGPFVKLCLIVL